MWGAVYTHTYTHARTHFTARGECGNIYLIWEAELSVPELIQILNKDKSFSIQ